MKEAKDLDRALMQAAGALPPPPEQVAEEITPWRDAFQKVLWGLALTMFKLRLFDLNLDVLLPVLGYLLICLGLRTLRRVNGAFRLAWGLALVRLCSQWLYLLMVASPLEFPPWAVGLMAAFHMAQPLALLLTLRAGVRRVWADGGKTAPGDPFLIAAVWYAGFGACAFAFNGGGAVAVVVLFVLFCFILAAIWRGAKALDGAGYGVEAAPVRMGGGWMFLLWWGSLAAIALLCTLCLSRAPLALEPAPPAGAGTETLREELRDLGFPEVVLADLDDGEVARYQGALSVYAAGQIITDEDYEYGFGPGWGGKLECVSVSVNLSQTQSRVLMWLRWLERPDLELQEGFTLRIGSEFSDSDGDLRDLDGAVLTTVDGKTLSAAFPALEATSIAADPHRYWDDGSGRVVGA